MKRRDDHDRVCLACLDPFEPHRHRHLCDPCHKSIRGFQSKPRRQLIETLAAVDVSARRLSIAIESPRWLYPPVDVQVDSGEG